MIWSHWDAIFVAFDVSFASIIIIWKLNFGKVVFHLVEAPMRHPVTTMQANFQTSIMYHWEGWILHCCFVIFTSTFLCQPCFQPLPFTCLTHWCCSFVLMMDIVFNLCCSIVNSLHGYQTERGWGGIHSMKDLSARFTCDKRSIHSWITGELVLSIVDTVRFYGWGDGNFGDSLEGWEFLLSYIGDNLGNIQEDKIALVHFFQIHSNG